MLIIIFKFELIKGKELLLIYKMSCTTLRKTDSKTISDRPSVKLQKASHPYLKNALIAISDWRYIDS